MSEVRRNILEILMKNFPHRILSLIIGLKEKQRGRSSAERLVEKLHLQVLKLFLALEKS